MDHHQNPSEAPAVNCKEEYVDDGLSWYAIKLLNAQQQAADTFLKEHGLETFIPLEYKVVEQKSGSLKRVLRPVIHNFIFLKKTISDKELTELLSKSPVKMAVMTKSADCCDFYEIASKQMYEFRIMCDPRITMRKYITIEDANLKSGDPVLVKYGPLRGLTGRLVRANKKYFLLKEIPGVAVMLKVSRWCCIPLQAGK